MTVWYNPISDRMGLCIDGRIYISVFFGYNPNTMMIGVCPLKKAKKAKWVKMGEL